MVEPKLLTEAEAHDIWERSFGPNLFVSQLRERGLIAEEPVDPLLIEAREVYEEWCEARNLPGSAKRIRAGEWDDTTPMLIALAALRRGMELAPATKLTRERLLEAVKGAGVWDTRNHWSAESLADRLHAALTQQVQP